jgi:HEAT repeat protein
MRSASAVAFGLLVTIVALAPAQDKTGKTATPDKAPDKAPDVAPDKMPEKKALTSIEEYEGKNLQQWTAELRSSDASVKEKAIAVIPVYGASASHLVPEFVKCCHDQDLGPKVKAIMALAVMEIDKKDELQVVGVLADILADRNEQLAAKLQAALTLTRFNDEARARALPGLIAGVNDGGSWQIRKASIMALRQIGYDKKDGPDKSATGALCSATGDSVYEVRLEAVQALGYLNKPKDPILYGRVHKKLSTLTEINDNAPEVDKVVAIWSHVSLMQIDGVTEAGVLNVTKYLSDHALQVRGQAVSALGALGIKGKPALPRLIDMLQDKDKGIVVAAAWSMVAIGDKDLKALNALKEMSERKDVDERVKIQLKLAYDMLKNSKGSDFAIPKDQPKLERSKTEPKR